MTKVRDGSPAQLLRLYNVVYDLMKNDHESLIEYFNIPINRFEGSDSCTILVEVYSFFNQYYLLDPPSLINNIKVYILRKKIGMDIIKDKNIDESDEDVIQLIFKKLKSGKPVDSFKKEIDKCFISREILINLFKKIGPYKTNISKKLRK